MKCLQNKAFIKIALFSFFEMRPQPKKKSLFIQMLRWFRLAALVNNRIQRL